MYNIVGHSASIHMLLLYSSFITLSLPNLHYLCHTPPFFIIHTQSSPSPGLPFLFLRCHLSFLPYYLISPFQLFLISFPTSLFLPLLSTSTSERQQTTRTTLDSLPSLSFSTHLSILPPALYFRNTHSLPRHHTLLSLYLFFFASSSTTFALQYVHTLLFLSTTLSPLLFFSTTLSLPLILHFSFSLPLFLHFFFPLPLYPHLSFSLLLFLYLSSSTPPLMSCSWL